MIFAEGDSWHGIGALITSACTLVGLLTTAVVRYIRRRSKNKIEEEDQEAKVRWQDAEQRRVDSGEVYRQQRAIIAAQGRRISSLEQKGDQRDREHAQIWSDLADCERDRKAQGVQIDEQNARIAKLESECSSLLEEHAKIKAMYKTCANNPSCQVQNILNPPPGSHDAAG